VTTAAVYARYSSELQSDRSIEDQVDLCRSYAQREGLIVTATYEDRAQSGASMQGRLGLARLLRDAADRLFTHLVVESLDRLSRDQADLASLYKRLTFLGIEIREVHGGKATPINTAVRGLVGAIYLADLADKTRRGMSGRVRDGKSAGGRAFGYRPVPGRPGELEIVEHEAEAVRRIYASYAAGESPRAIAGALNLEGVTPPRGGRWNASTINGSRARGNGILGNALYRGEIVWNKVRMVKDPDTGRRVSRPNPPAEWQRRHAQALQIVPDDLWQAVEARRRAVKERLPTAPRFKVKHLLSGLLKCHCCGGSLVVRDRQAGRTRIECSTQRESGTCDNRKLFYLDRIERAVITALKAEMTSPALIAAYVAEYNAERRRLARDQAGVRAKLEARLAAATAEIERTVTLMVKGIMDPDRHAPRLKELEAEERRLRAELSASASTGVVELHPAAIERYRMQLERLEREITGAPEAMQSLRALVARVTVTPDYGIEIEGRLSELLGVPVYPSAHGAAVTGNGRPPTRFEGGGPVVAGGRLNRSPTFLLRAAA
jgi:DNA invertase Pin-like site-specific DNA recombinase